MRKLLFALVMLVFSVTSCTEQNPDGSYPIEYHKGFSLSTHSNPQVIVIDSCEYIYWMGGITHKGNCRFCEDRRKQEYEVFLENIEIELY